MAVKILYFICIVLFFTFKTNAQSIIENSNSNITVVDFNSDTCIYNLFVTPEIMEDTLFSDTLFVNCKIPSYAVNEADFNQNPFQNNGESINIKVKIIYEKGIKRKVEGFYENGMRYRESYMNKKGIDGTFRTWYINGQLLSFGIFEDGKRISPNTKWYSNGNIKYFSEENNGRKVILEWYKNGNLGRESRRVDLSSESIIVKDYYETGELLSEAIYNNGEQIYKAYWKNGCIGRKGKMFNMTLYLLGKWEDWYEDGQLKLESFYHDSIPNIKTGTWKYWNKIGELIKEETYEDNELINVKEYWDVTDPKTNKKIKEIDFEGNQIWPDGSKNKNKR